jgi:uncharacterized protein YqiB (DUF1249 family)
MVSFSQPNGLHSRPKLKRLHDVQEEIFRLLQLLIPDEFAYTDHLKSVVAGSPLLRMQVLERHAYTTFFRLTYEFAETEESRFMPDAHIRCYHDARMAEATSFDCQQACVRDTHPAWPPRQMMQRAWRKNRALERWLDHLLSQGHSVVTMQAARHSMETGPSANALIAVT